MLLSEFLAQEGNEHARQGNPHVKCNAIGKTERAFNCKLLPAEAIEAARCLLQKAQLILDNKIEDAVVHVWNVKPGNHSLYFGLKKAVVKHRKKATGRRTT